ncbi:MAG: NAD(P)-binding domain-containing protein [Spirochaetaceae bacterium]|nr:NAD(P)-binding domain-containing protein [Spirochaetaceae bacterium]
MNIGIIGYGSMGKMILEKFIETKSVEQSKLFVSNRTYKKIMDLNNYYPQLNICENNIELVKNVDIIFICVKPLEIKVLLSEIVNDIRNTCHIISLNGSILFKRLEQISINNKISKIIPVLWLR